MIPRWLALAVPVYFTALLAIDTQVRLPGQLVLGAVTWGALAGVCALIPTERRAQVLVVVELVARDEPELHGRGGDALLEVEGVEGEAVAEELDLVVLARGVVRLRDHRRF